MLLPEVNIKYAAELLTKLKQDYGEAIRPYHSEDLNIIGNILVR
jgi:hypothetical protein